MRIAFIEPHLRCYGGIRRVLELSNSLTRLGHDVVLYVPEFAVEEPRWMKVSARVEALRPAHPEPLDVLIFNHEPQWYVLDRFTDVRIRVFYALHYAALYDKPGVYESLRAPVDLVMANSRWTADRVAEEVGVDAVVQLGGINSDHFRSFDVEKKHAVLAYGDRKRPWKGTATIDEACRLVGLNPHYYAGKGYAQCDMGRVYSSSEVFVVGSWFEGFCQPGLEALACGTPLVTTDCGGAGEYAIHEETALVVPPKDPRAMADAIERLRSDRALAEKLVKAGLSLVSSRFNWDEQAEVFAARLEESILEASKRMRGPRSYRAQSPAVPRDVASIPTLSIVTLAWNGLELTQAFVERIRRHTEVPYELIVVDNGSEFDAREYARLCPEVSVLNESNLGFAEGMNQGLAEARGTYVAFMNNDTKVNEGWDRQLLETLESFPNAGIVAPVVTSGGSAITVRNRPGQKTLIAIPFEEAPAAVVYVMQRKVAVELGGFGTEFPVASAEDVDMCFKVWVNGLDIVIDERVLIEHVSKGTARMLEDWETTWEENRRLFLEKWVDENVDVPYLARVNVEEFHRMRLSAVGVARWMKKYFWALDQLRGGDKGRRKRKEARLGLRQLNWQRDTGGRRRFWQKKWMSIRKRLPPWS